MANWLDGRQKPHPSHAGRKGHPQYLLRRQERIPGRIGPQDENAITKAITTEDTEYTEKCYSGPTVVGPYKGKFIWRRRRIPGRVGPRDENAKTKAITTEDTEYTEKRVTERDSAKS